MLYVFRRQYYGCQHFNAIIAEDQNTGKQPLVQFESHLENRYRTPSRFIMDEAVITIQTDGLKE